jgi:hypothetical protein
MVKPEGKIIDAVQHITADIQNCFRSFLATATSCTHGTLCEIESGLNWRAVN